MSMEKTLAIYGSRQLGGKKNAKSVNLLSVICRTLFEAIVIAVSSALMLACEDSKHFFEVI